MFLGVSGEVVMWNKVPWPRGDPWGTTMKQPVRNPINEQLQWGRFGQLVGNSSIPFTNQCCMVLFNVVCYISNII